MSSSLVSSDQWWLMPRRLGMNIMPDGMRYDSTAASCPAALGRYKTLRVWGRSPILPRDGYDRLKDGLVSGDFCRGVDYATAVDNSLADAAVAEDPPSL